MRELKEREAVIQVWSKENPEGDKLSPLVESIITKLKDKPELGTFTEEEGPTPHIPDFFCIMYGFMYGRLIYVSEADPVNLKRFVMNMEHVGDKRIADIDIYTSYFDCISRKDSKYKTLLLT